MRTIFPIGLLALTSACAAVENAPATNPDTSLPYFGDGYPAAGDPCRRLGESDLTRDWLDHTRDLVGCPAGPAADALRASAGAQVVAANGNTVILSMPR